MSDGALLSVRDLKVHFPVRVGGLFGRVVPVKAVDGVSFDLRPGETLGVVGESGCGKSTLGRAILQLIPPTGGTVLWLGERIEGLSQSHMRAKREDMQIIFQDPLASLDPRMTIGDIIAEPLRTFQPKLPRREVRPKAREPLPAQRDAARDEVGVEVEGAGLLDERFQVASQQRLPPGEVQLHDAQVLGLTEDAAPVRGVEPVAVAGEVDGVRAVDAPKGAPVRQLGDQRVRARLVTHRRGGPARARPCAACCCPSRRSA